MHLRNDVRTIIGERSEPPLSVELSEFSLYLYIYVKVNNTTLERVSSFKYLGLLFKPNLSWSTHIASIKKKAKKILGLIYRHFYQHCPSSTLITLYKTLVRPILEYAAVIWDPTSKSASNSLESVQHFALKLSSKSWSSNYSSLLTSFKIPTLLHRRKCAKIIVIHKSKSGLSHSINSPLRPALTPLHLTRQFSPLNFQPIFCRTSSYYNSFYPSAIKIWNSLPTPIKSLNSLSLLKLRLKSHSF